MSDTLIGAFVSLHGILSLILLLAIAPGINSFLSVTERLSSVVSLSPLLRVP